MSRNQILSLPKRAGLAVATLLLALTILVLVSIAQTLSPGEVRLSSRPYVLGVGLRAESRLVDLEVVVRDKRGRAVLGLTKDEFNVYDSGKNRDIAAFSVETFSETVGTASSSASRTSDMPAQPQSPAQGPTSPSSSDTIWIGLLFDDINMPPGDVAHAKIAASRFIKEAVRSGDRIAVFVTSGGALTEFTNDSAAILTAVAKVQSHPRISTGGLAQCPRMTAYEAYQIVNNDPSAMKAKVTEACNCGGSQGCSVEWMRDTDLLNPTTRAADPYGGAGALSTVIDSVRAQADQTWEQAHLASQATLDAIKSSLDQLARPPGKRMLLIASSGFLSGMLDADQDSIINEALHAGVVINSLDAKGLYAEAPGTPLNESVESVELPVSTSVFQMRSLGDNLESLDSGLARLAESTGGLLFRNNNDLDLGFHELGVLPACTYLLAFTPAEDGKYHKIKVELKNARHDFVQVRPGYFAPSKASGGQQNLAVETDALMSTTDEETDLPATISDKLGTSKTGNPQLTIQAHFDIQELPFEKQKDRHVQKLTFTAALFDLRGSFVTGKQAEMDLALKPESFDRFSKTGINGIMQLEVSPGTYRLRMVVRESLHGHISATTRDVQIR